MASSNVSQYQYSDIQTVLVDKLTEWHKHFPDDSTKPIHVLPVVRHDDPDLFQSSLENESNEHNGERIILIPYYFGNSHCTGILLEFNADGSINRAEYTDPVKGTIPNKLQSQFKEVYSESTLQVKDLPQQHDAMNSAAITIESLLAGVNVDLSKITPVTSITSSTNNIPNEGNGNELYPRLDSLEHNLESHNLQNTGGLQIGIQNEGFDDRGARRSYIENLRTDCNSMPPCAEKIILELLIHFNEKQLEGASSLTRDSKIELLQKLREQMIREQFFSEWAQTRFQELNIIIENSNDSSVVACLSKLLTRIRPLHVQEMQRLVLKANQAADLIRNQDILLLLGETGSGKSTMIQFLAGCRMTQKKVEIASGCFLVHITTDDIGKDPRLTNVISSPFNRSETRYIASVTVQLKDILGSCEDGDVVLCDAPGFGDTAGPEVDIANSLGVIEALKQTKSVKLLVLSSYTSLGDRGQDIQKLTNILVNMVDRIENKFESIFYAFTKYPSEINVNAELLDIKMSKVDRDEVLASNKPFVAVLKDMIAKTGRTELKVHPIRDHPSTLMKILKSGTGIEHPEEVFRFPMSSDTRETINKHIQRDRGAIDCGMKLKDMHLVSYYLNDLKKLNDLLKQDDIREIYNKCKSSIHDKIQEFCHEVLNNFARVINSQDGLKEDDLQDYKIAVEYLQQTEAVKQHLGSSLSPSTTLKHGIDSQLEARRIALQSEELHSPMIAVYLENIRLLKASFREFEQNYASSCQKYEKRFQELLQSGQEIILTNDFKSIAEVLLKISKAVDNLQIHIHDSIVAKYNNTVQSLLRRLSQYSDQVNVTLAKSRISSDDVKILQDIIGVLRSAKETYALREVISKHLAKCDETKECCQDLDSIYELFLTKIIECFDKLIQQIANLIETNEDNTLDIIHQTIENIKTIHKIPEVEIRTVTVYYNIIESIRSYMTQLQRNTRQSLDTIDHQSGNIDCKELLHSFKLLENAKWMNTILPGSYDTAMHRLNEEFTECVGQFEQRLKRLDLSLKYPDRIIVAKEILEKTEYLCTLQPDTQELAMYRHRMLNHVVYRIRLVYNEVAADFACSDETDRQETTDPRQFLETTSVFTRSHSQNSIDVDMSTYLFVEQQPTLESIRSDKRQLQESVRRLESYVDEYERILYGNGLLNAAVKVFSRTIKQTEKVKPVATTYLLQKGYHNIDAVRKTIAKFKRELESLNKQEKVMNDSQMHQQSSEPDSRSSDTTNVPIKRRKYKSSKGLVDKSQMLAANNALIYFKNCEQIGYDRIRVIADDAIEIVKQYLDNFISSLEQKINEVFARATEIENYRRENSSKYSQDIEIHLQALDFLSRFSEVYEHIDGQEKLKSHQQQYRDYYETLKSRMEQYKSSGQSRELRDHLLIAQTLTCIDRFLQGDFLLNGYQELYKKYQFELIQDCEKASAIVLACIDKSEYDNVDAQLSHMDEKFVNPLHFAHIKYSLQSSLHNLMNDIERDVNNLEEKLQKDEQNQQCVQNLKSKINKVRFVLEKPLIMNLLDEYTCDRLRNFSQRIDKTLSVIFLSNIESIGYLLDTDRFVEAQQLIDIVVGLHRKLAEHCKSEEVFNRLETINERMNNIVPEIWSRYSLDDMYNYVLNPPKTILKKLEIAASQSGAKYAKAHQDLSQKIQQYLITTIEKERTSPLVERTHKIRMLNNVAQYLPDDLKTTFQSKLDELQIETIERENEYNQDLEACLRNLSDDDRIIAKLGKLAKEYQKEKLDGLFNRLRAEVLKKLSTYQTLVQTSLDERNLPKAFDCMKKIFEYKQYLSNSISETEEISQSVIQLTRRRFFNCCEILAGISSIEQASTVETAFNDILVYLHSSEIFDKKVVLLFSDDILHDATQELENMFRYLRDIEKRFRITLNAKNFHQLGQLLVISKKWDPCLEKIRQCRSKHPFMKNFVSITKNLTQHTDMIDEVENLVRVFIEQVNVELVTDDTIRFEVKRNELYANLAISMNTLRAIGSKLNDFLSSMIDTDGLEKVLEAKIEIIINQLLEKISKEELSQKDTDEFRIYYNHLASFSKHVNLFKARIEQVLAASEEKITTKVTFLHKQIVTDSLPITGIAPLLIKMKFLAENLSMFDRKICDEIDETLKTYKDQRGILSIMALVVELEKDGIGMRLISEHSCLSGESWRRRRDKMQKQDDIDYVLRELSGDAICLQTLRTRYETFRKKYDELITENLRSIDVTRENKSVDVGALVTQIKFMTGSVIDTSKEIIWQYSFEQKIPQLVAYIFAVWTLKNTQHYNTARGIDAAKSYLLIPHVGQVITIFRLLGIGYTSNTMTRIFRSTSTKKISESLVNNLVEIGTGEGKSVVMAITACVFALTGIDVNCSCYSKVLSTRDKKDFKSVFEALGVENRIKYGTFDKLCEQFLNEKCNIRDQVSEMITKNKDTLPNIDKANGTNRTNPKVLLIDEVDVFLSDRFYGGTYRPVVILNDPPIRALLSAIWEKKESITANEVKSLPAYQTCAFQYSDWIFIFHEAIKDMVGALRSFKSPKYIVRNNKICYVQDESVVDSIVYGYNTMWAYYDEHSKGNITENSLEENVGLLVNCGEFCYAEMPHDFAYIAGVTGTLKTLAKSEKYTLTNVYQIHEHTFMPSVFAKSNRTYDSSTDVEVMNDSEYFIRIRREIDSIRQAERAILVFFKSQDALIAFYNSVELSSLKESVQLITEEVSTEDRDRCVKHAARQGQVTLITRIFGRGTDFICDTPQVLAKGGVHVLQTFFSMELAEEYQIMGRSARQGDRGSYRMIILDKDLEWVFGLTWKDKLPTIERSKLYETLHTARQAIYESKCSAKNLSLEQRKLEHQVSKDFVSALCKGNIRTVKRFLGKRNKGIDLLDDSSRTLVLISGPGSLYVLLSSMKEIICTIFQRASAILDKMDLPSDVIQMQIAVYQNCTVRGNEVLQYSSWHSKGSSLRAFLNTINYARSALENSMEVNLPNIDVIEKSLSQVIFIGSASVNITRERSDDEYSDSLHEIKRLIEKKIPIHT
ncbi:unnamed protein product, partial [Adineta ricciae]